MRFMLLYSSSSRKVILCVLINGMRSRMLQMRKRRRTREPSVSNKNWMKEISAIRLMQARQRKLTKITQSIYNLREKWATILIISHL
jgi:hypothetical protein